MDETKKKILESIGCIVGTNQEYLRIAEAEAEFLKRMGCRSRSVKGNSFQQEQGLDRSGFAQAEEHRSADQQSGSTEDWLSGGGQL